MTKIKTWFNANRYFGLGIIGAALVAVVVIASSGFQSLGIGEQSIEAEFVQAAGIKVGDKVDVAGVPVGRVSGAELEGDHVVITLQVSDDVKLGPDAHASIKMATLLGARYIDLEPGDGSGLPDKRIPKTNTTVPYNLADVVQRGTPKFEELDTAKLAESLNLVNQQLGGSPELIAQALDSVGALAKTIDSRKTQVDTLLKDLDRVTTILADNRNSVLLVVTQGEAIASRVMERQNLLRQLLDNVATLTAQLQQIGAQNDNQFSGTLDQLNIMASGLQKNKDNLDRLLSIMPPAVRYLANAWGNGNYAEVSLPWLFPDNWLCFAQVAEGCA
ncbi:MCE family protein [Nocardia cyriacigeorgica]|jgi:phospholipid/cholesterol/gamma-HCH transport system substrate-binding protein|uniref:Mce family protein n=2 Tax=Nocardia cyriacigeorgica TaxID=135487 RepID=H6RAR3_NOCCG|nr:MCE family protein [Nocardia cyriacigeorgica]AVH21529.1 MCE family protein [Nocardia cyriacigeorgica]MBF6286926.1 MCE family protein [Nocardia cyriacigeorgica]MBF6315595.1 MCE family protein [Nocardia cyriacigeorgica]MBF6320974.1 MCE family protein [Nocardia cyriacigeorgica]MBF6425150.1 MCE family protein [Nocardia cyriacigeorgica]